MTKSVKKGSIVKYLGNRYKVKSIEHRRNSMFGLPETMKLQLVSLNKNSKDTTIFIDGIRRKRK
jgi:hypothetical protein